MQRLVSAFFLVLISVSAASAQTQERRFDRFKVQLLGAVYSARDGVLTSDQLTGIRDNGQSFNVPRADVISIQYVDGTRWRAGLIGGAAGGALVVLLETIQPSILNERPGAGTALGFIAVGAVAGAIWGATQEHWEEFIP